MSWSLGHIALLRSYTHSRNMIYKINIVPLCG